MVVDIVAIYLSIRLTPQMFRHLDGNEVSKKSRPEVYLGLGLGLVTEQTSLTIWSIGGQYNIFVSMEALSRSVGMNTYSVQGLDSRYSSINPGMTFFKAVCKNRTNSSCK